MTIGKDITTTIHKTLLDAKACGKPVVPCTTLWSIVGKGHALGDLYFRRYKSVLAELIQTTKIKVHRDEEGRPAGFELVKH